MLSWTSLKAQEWPCRGHGHRPCPIWTELCAIRMPHGVVTGTNSAPTRCIAPRAHPRVPSYARPRPWTTPRFDSNSASEPHDGRDATVASCRSSSRGPLIYTTAHPRVPPPKLWHPIVASPKGERPPVLQKPCRLGRTGSWPHTPVGCSVLMVTTFKAKGSALGCILARHTLPPAFPRVRPRRPAPE